MHCPVGIIVKIQHYSSSRKESNSSEQYTDGSNMEPGVIVEEFSLTLDMLKFMDWLITPALPRQVQRRSLRNAELWKRTVLHWKFRL